MSPAARAGSPPGPRCESPGTAELLYAVSAAGTAFAGVQPGRVLGLEAACLEAVFGALLKHVGWAVCGAVVQPSSGVPAGRRIAGPGPRQPVGRAVTLSVQPGTPCWSETADHEWPRRTDCRTAHL
jgi:hypothetical protein